MDRITAIAICEALLYELQPFDEQPKEAFQMALDALCEQEELGKELTNAVELIHKKNNRINELLKEHKTGHWIFKGYGSGICSECKFCVGNIHSSKYCPNCGAKMEIGTD